jgi:hypothetical protein
MSGVVPGRHVTLARIPLIALGCAALIWGSAVMPIFWQHARLELVAKRIINGEQFKIENLTNELTFVATVEQSAFCRPAALRSAAIIRLRIAEQTLSTGPRGDIDAQTSSALATIREGLACAPADAFLWLALYWIDATRSSFFSQENLKYLRMSYELGPNEGWIALRRNRLAFSMFRQLPPDLAENAINEFIALLETGLYEQIVDIFTGPAWSVHEMILPRLSETPERSRREFSRVMHDRGYDVTIPGIEPYKTHPWE